MSGTPAASGLQHRLRRMTGRDIDQAHRAATPLELLFDLTFVVAFGQAADQAAHYLAEGHALPALAGFGLAMLAVCWAWVNFSWFASAYDTDDWFFRVATMVQMVGVLVLALGLPALFVSLDAGAPIANDVMVAGYVVMRIALVAQWLRAAQQDRARRRTALTYAVLILVAQVGWVTLLSLRTSWVGFVVLVIVVVLDFGGPAIAERTGETPWHPQHIAERYGLLVIIALGEGVIGTIASVSAIVQRDGWSAEAVLNVVAGTGLTFGLWWVYFTVPSGLVLARHRSRANLWGYLHIPIFASIAATGAGLHVAASVIGGDAHIDATAAVLSVVVPVLVFVVLMFVVYAYLMRSVDPFHFALLVGTVVLLALAVVLSAAGVSMGVCLLVAMLAPFVTVVGYELLGYRHEAAALERVLA